MAEMSGNAPVSTQSEDLGVIQQVIANNPNRTFVEIKPEHGYQKSDIRRLLVGLTQNSHVKELRMAGLGLNDDEGSLLVEALKTCHVEKLLLNDNNLSGHVVQQVFQVITERGIVKDIEIKGQQNRQCTDEEMEEIKNYLKSNHTLQVVSLDIPLDDPDAVRELFRNVPTRRKRNWKLRHGTETSRR